MTELRQTTLTANMTLKDKVKLCHSRIPQARHIEGFLDSGLIAPLPIWSPVQEKYRKTAQDSFSIWGLEAQHPKYLPAILQPFVRIEKRDKRKHKRKPFPFLNLLEGAYKHSVVFSFNGEDDSKDLEKFQRVKVGHYDEQTDVITIYLDTITKTVIDDFGHIISFAGVKIYHGEYTEPVVFEQPPEKLAEIFCSVLNHEYIHRTLWLLGLKEACTQYDHHAFYENVECEEVEQE